MHSVFKAEQHRMVGSQYRHFLNNLTSDIKDIVPLTTFTEPTLVEFI